jgi:hypothetical protein
VKNKSSSVHGKMRIRDLCSLKIHQHRLTLALVYFFLSFFILIIIVAFFGHFCKHQYAEQHRCIVDDVNVTTTDNGKLRISWSLSHNRSIVRTKSPKKVSELEKKYQVGSIYNCFVSEKKVYWENPNINSFFGYIVGILLSLGQCGLSIYILIQVNKCLALEENTPLDYKVIYSERVY